ncbi:MAG TPA: hypothetical protein VFR88_16750, partial [Microlunatus sp.]|nr:hypothetical protein [Microlunatus sp.]
MSSRVGLPLRIAAVSATCAVVCAMTSLSAAAAEDDVQVINTETVSVYTDATGAVDTKRIYEQLALTGSGSVELSNPIETQGLRNLDSFGGFEIKDGEQVAEMTVDGKERLRSVSDFTGDLPLDVRVRYFLEGEEVEPGDVVGESGRLEVRYTVKNVTGVEQELTFDDGQGGTITKTVEVPIPMVGSLTTVAPPNFTNVASDQANMAGDGKGGTRLSFTMTLFPPIGSDTAEFGYTANITDGVVPRAAISALPVNPLESPSFKTAGESYKGGAETGIELVNGAGQIDENLLKLRDGASELLAGLIQLRAGAVELKAGLAGVAAPGANRLAAGAAELRNGLDLIDDGASKVAAGNAEAAAGGEELSAGATQLEGGARRASAGAKELASGTETARAGGRRLAAGTGTARAGGRQLATGAGTAAAGGAELAAGTGTAADGGATLAEGTGTAADGGATLAEGTGTAADGGATLAEGTGTAADGGATLAEGTGTAAAGGAELAAGTGTAAAGGAELAAGLDELNTGAGELSAGLGELLAGGQALSEGFNSSTGEPDLVSGSQTLVAGLQQISDGLTQLADAQTGLPAAAAGAQALSAGVARLRVGISNPACDPVNPTNPANPCGLLEGLQALQAGFNRDNPNDPGLILGANLLAGGVEQLLSTDPAAPGLPVAKGGVDTIAGQIRAATAAGGSVEELVGNLEGIRDNFCGSVEACATALNELIYGIESTTPDDGV